MLNDEKVNALSQRLIDGVGQIFLGDNFKKYLKTVSEFHNLSPRNALSIFLQYPSATHVAGFEAWKKRGRYVRRGETGISIFAPSKVVVQLNKPLLDESGNPTLDDEGHPKTEKIQKTLIHFRTVSVFDVSQTEGEPIPALCKNLRSAVPDYQKIFKAVQNISPYKIGFEQIGGGIQGDCRHWEHKIAIQAGMSDEQIVKALIHEYVYAVLHADSIRSKIEAESIAFIVSNFFGIETSGYCFDSVFIWSQGMSSEQLQVELENIQDNANVIIHRIDTAMENLKKEKSYEQLKLPQRLSEASRISERLSAEKEVIPSGKLLVE